MKMTRRGGFETRPYNSPAEVKGDESPIFALKESQ
jgi:hypothetical protein